VTHRPPPPPPRPLPSPQGRPAVRLGQDATGHQGLGLRRRRRRCHAHRGVCRYPAAAAQGGARHGGGRRGRGRVSWEGRQGAGAGGAWQDKGAGIQEPVAGAAWRALRNVKPGGARGPRLNSPRLPPPRRSDVAIDVAATSKAAGADTAAADAKAVGAAAPAPAAPSLMQAVRGSRAWRAATAGVNYDVHKVGAGEGSGGMWVGARACNPQGRSGQASSRRGAADLGAAHRGPQLHPSQTNPPPPPRRPARSWTRARACGRSTTPPRCLIPRPRRASSTCRWGQGGGGVGGKRALGFGGCARAVPLALWRPAALFSARPAAHAPARPRQVCTACANAFAHGSSERGRRAAGVPEPAECPPPRRRAKAPPRRVNSPTPACPPRPSPAPRRGRQRRRPPRRDLPGVAGVERSLLRRCARVAAGHRRRCHRAGPRHL
jgi:hypothetical protein